MQLCYSVELEEESENLVGHRPASPENDAHFGEAALCHIEAPS